MVKTCRSCGRPWRKYVTRPCDKGADCWECNLVPGGAPEHIDGVDTDFEDYDEVETYRCPHGAEWEWRCRGCGHVVGGWGAGSAGFGELCGCANESEGNKVEPS